MLIYVYRNRKVFLFVLLGKYVIWNVTQYQTYILNSYDRHSKFLLLLTKKAWEICFLAPVKGRCHLDSHTSHGWLQHGRSWHKRDQDPGLCCLSLERVLRCHWGLRIGPSIPGTIFVFRTISASQKLSVCFFDIRIFCPNQADLIYQLQRLLYYQGVLF